MCSLYNISICATNSTNHTKSWFDSTPTTTTCFTWTTLESRSLTNSVHTFIISSAGIIITAFQGIVICPRQLVVLMTILWKPEINANGVFLLDLFKLHRHTHAYMVCCSFWFVCSTSGWTPSMRLKRRIKTNLFFVASFKYLSLKFQH